MTQNNLNERARIILNKLIEQYISDGQPVGSKKLAESADVQLSSATIRNIMADLEQAGYLKSPHTSAGRIPTEQAYRFYVDALLNVDQPEKYLIHQLQQKLSMEYAVSGEGDKLVETASNMLSSLTQLAGIVTLPKRERMLLRHIEFLPLSNRRVLVILVCNDHDVQNRVIQTDKDFNESELISAANYIMAQFGGKELSVVRQGLAQAMQDDRTAMENAIQQALKIADEALTTELKDNYVIAGEAHLFDLAEISGIEQLRSLFSAFTEKQDMLHLLDRCLHADGLQIFIGQESGMEVFDGCTFIAAPYANKDETLGVLGVIGPTRIDYERVISTVDVTARLLSTILGTRDE